jgi:hypothetical protein
MGVGFEAYADNGNVQFTSNDLLFYLRKTGTATVTASGDFYSNYVRVPGASTYPGAIVGFSGGGGYAVGYELNGGANWSYITDAPVGTVFNYYIYDTSDKVPGSNFGIEVYNEAGQITFSVAQRALLSLALLYMPNDNSVSVTFAGKSLGFIPTSWAGYNRYGPSDTGEPGYYYHDWAVYGAACINSGQTVATGVVAVPGGRGDVDGNATGGQPINNDFEVPGNFFIIDVTNIPIGATFF